MVVANRIAWIRDKLASGHGARINLSSSDAGLRLRVCLAPQANLLIDNSATIALLDSVAGQLSNFVAVDHGHKATDGRSLVSIALRRRHPLPAPLDAHLPVDQWPHSHPLRVAHVPAVDTRPQVHFAPDILAHAGPVASAAHAHHGDDVDDLGRAAHAPPVVAHPQVHLAPDVLAHADPVAPAPHAHRHDADIPLGLAALQLQAWWRGCCARRVACLRGVVYSLNKPMIRSMFFERILRQRAGVKSKQPIRDCNPSGTQCARKTFADCKVFRVGSVTVDLWGRAFLFGDPASCSYSELAAYSATACDLLRILQEEWHVDLSSVILRLVKVRDEILQSCRTGRCSCSTCLATERYLKGLR